MTEKNELEKEIEELTKQQSEAVEQAVDFPMTVEESNSFDERANLIDKLHRELMKFQAAA
jgi:hypothetical protein